MAEFWKVIKTRRSVREFKDRDVPSKYINKLIEAASFAPSGSNKQNWHFVVAKSQALKIKMKQAIIARIEEFAKKMDAKEKEALFQYAEYYTFFVNAPLVVAIVMKPYVSYTGELIRQYEPDTKYTSTAGIQSVAAAVENLLLAAKALGLGSCWMTGPLIAKDALEDILGIKPPDELLALVPIGFPKENPSAPKRLPVNEIMTVV